MSVESHPPMEYRYDRGDDSYESYAWQRSDAAYELDIEYDEDPFPEPIWEMAETFSNDGMNSWDALEAAKRLHRLEVTS